jgi:hypothetical protein
MKFYEGSWKSSPEEWNISPYTSTEGADKSLRTLGFSVTNVIPGWIRIVSTVD